MSAQAPALPQPYYFNASRWVWTGDAQEPISWDSVRYDETPIYVKIARIALLCLFAPVIDVIYMAVEAFRNRRVSAVQPRPPLNEVAREEILDSRRVKLYLQKKLKTSDLLVLVSSYLSQEGRRVAYPLSHSQDRLALRIQSMSGFFSLKEALGDDLAKFSNDNQNPPSLCRFITQLDLSDVSWFKDRRYAPWIANFAHIFPKTYKTRFTGSPEQVCAVIKRLFPSVVRIRLPECDAVDSANYTDGLLTQYQTTIEGVSLSGSHPFVTGKTLTTLCSCPKLFDVSLRVSNLSIIDAAIRAHLGRPPVNPAEIPSLEPLFNRRALTSVNLNYSKRLSLNELNALLANPLEKLVFQWNTEFPEGWEAVLISFFEQHGANLTTLHVIPANRLMEAISSHCPNLVEFSTQFHNVENYLFLPPLLSRLTKLRVFTEMGNSSWNSREIVNLFKLVPSLGKAVIMNTQNVSPYVIKELGKLKREITFTLRTDILSRQIAFFAASQRHPRVRVEFVDSP